MASSKLVELRGPQRDGTAQAERPRPELAAGAIGIDERGPAELIAFARRFASQLMWYDGDNQPAGWWAAPEADAGAGTTGEIGLPGEPPRGGPTFFDGIGPGAGGTPSGLSYDEVARFLANPADRSNERYALLRRPHMALFLTAVRLMGHGQRVLNQLTERHLEYHLSEVLRLTPRPAEPDRAYVLFELGAGVRAADVPAGLRLLAGRDARHRDRIYRLDEPLIVNRARVARLASTFVDREITGLAAARRSITGTSEEQFLFLLSLALGAPKPGDPLPPFRGKPMTLAVLGDFARFIAFARPALFLELFELRAMLAVKARRASEAAEWQRINKIIETAGGKKRGDAAWQLQTAKPSDLAGNLALALGGAPDLGGLTEVETVDDLALHLDRDDVRAVIETKLFMDPGRQFKPMMDLKRSIDADWRVINGYLELAGRNKRPAKPDWPLKITDQAAFADNLATAIGRVDYTAAGPAADGVVDPETYLARLEEIEAWFFLPAEDVARLVATFGASDSTAEGARAWRDAYALLAEAHGRKVRASEAAALREIRLRPPPPGKDGIKAEFEAALGDVPADLDGRMEALARYVPAEDVEFVRTLLSRFAGRMSAEGLEQADAILAEARRVRLRLVEPVAQKEHWRALWAYDDAQTARAGADAPAWRCFGGIPADAGLERPPATIGWAIASPMLALSAGRRRIVLTLGFHDDGGGALIAPADDPGTSPRKLPFTVTLSSAKDWIEASQTSFAEVAYKSVAPVEAGLDVIGLEVTLTLDESAPEVAPSPATVVFGATPWPVLRLMLRPVWDEEQGLWDTAYERFRGLKLARVHVAAAVGSYVVEGAPGLWPLAVETESGVANGKKPFEPFGAKPSIGSELALGHRDLLHKRLTETRISFEWLGGPPSLKDHYALYEPWSFTAQVSMVDGGVRTTPLDKPKPLFADDNTSTPVWIELPTGDATRPDPVVEPLDAEVRGWRRYLTLRLAGTDFGHHDYSSLATSKSIALAKLLRNPPAAGFDEKAYTVNPPYTPKMKRIGLDFTAAHEINVGHYNRSSAIDRLFHVHPFGVEEAVPTGDAGWPLLPAYDDEGALYIGLAGVEAPQSLSLLFAGVEAGEAQDRTGPLRWSYLDSGGWVDFPEPPEDQTQGLVRRGIVRLALPRARGAERMPAGLYWVRATMASGAANACDLVDIHAQAGSAHFVDDGALPDHYQSPLPAKTIRSLIDPAPGIARVVQPYATGEGRPAEDSGAFRTRAAERLRHKGRALTLWDYERLVLERFAEVHKVKCVPASVFDDAPGTVRLVIIPDIRGEARGDAFAPRASARLLDEIAAFLLPLAPPTATIVVGHARFVQVRVRLGVRFRAGGDEDFDKRRLAEHLNRYLAPWAFDEGSNIAIGQRIDATSIVAFIDQLPFVDFVGTCRLFVSDDGGATFHPGDKAGESVEASGEDGVLTPAPRHEIDVITDDLFEQGEFTGVGYMKVELDFVVH